MRIAFFIIARMLCAGLAQASAGLVRTSRARGPLHRRASWLVGALVFGIANSHAQTPPEPDLADLTLEELGNVEITSVSRRTQSLADAPASVFVITAEDIRRSGATRLPEALRLAPNLHVAEAYANTYTISARGFNTSAGNKLLVLIDGRTVYSPLFSGVFWDVQDVMLEDIDRIEVISGPAGTLWGTNAVNGVINIITRSAAATQGGLVALGGGNTEVGGAVRYGAKAGANGYYRLYGKHFDGEHSETASGLAVNDEWRHSQVGFRADWQRATDQFTLQGDAYDGRRDQAAPGTINIAGVNRPLNRISTSGLNLNARWRHRFDGGSDLTVQAYYDRVERDVPGTFDDTLNVFDLQLQHALQPLDRHSVVWGAEYRHGDDNVDNSDFIALLPAEVEQQWISLFAQDEIALSDNLRFTLGARLENNEYTGNEWLPNARLAWKVRPDHVLWAAASRTVRAPSRIDRDFHFPATGPFLIAGGPNFRSESAHVYEIGYRGQPAEKLSYSVTAFHTVYDHLRTLEFAPSGTFLIWANEMEGTATGVEMWGSYQVLPTWRLSGGFTRLDKDLELEAGASGFNGGVRAEGNDPESTWQLRSTLDLTDTHDFDVMVRRVGALPVPQVPSYVAVDMRVAWRLHPDVELSLTGRNLFDSGHAEFGDIATRSEFGRSFFLKVQWRL